MNYRRRHNRRDHREPSFFRNWKFEGPKEALGKLAEWGGTTLGTLAGAAAARNGFPAGITIGSALGWAAGAAAKTAIVAGLDRLKSRGEASGGTEPDADQTGHEGTTDTPPSRVARPSSERPATRRGPQLGRRAGHATRSHGNGALGVAGVMVEIQQIITVIEHNHQGLVGSMDRIGDNHAWLLTVLAGANPMVLLRVDGQLGGARRAIEETCKLLRLSKDNLRGYLRTI